MVSAVVVSRKPCFLYVCLILLLSVVVTSTTARAQAVGPGCDPEFMKAMQDKGWMEAQREIMIAQTTIAKPDTVFALGCIKSFHDGFNPTIKFSDNNKFDYMSKITSFVGSAFNHDLGGGHFSGKNSELNNCGAMASLWKAARCANLDLPSKLLHTLQDMKNYDRGKFPETCSTPAGAWEQPLKKFYETKDENKSLGAKFDDMKLFLDVTAPLSQTEKKECAKGIPTGIVFADDRKEIICPNPGCISDGEKEPKCIESK